MSLWVVKCSGCVNWEETSSPAEINVLLKSDKPKGKSDTS